MGVCLGMGSLIKVQYDGARGHDIVLERCVEGPHLTYRAMLHKNMENA